ncbi:MAG: acetyl-CoA carboxylase biotin carboxyl carrier protein [Planctomycetota bacterium]|jgi:acetyl-CoA carboxylase biotin carboxyl carrier protein
MDIKEIKQLIKLMMDNDLAEIDIANGDNKIAIKRGVGEVPVVAGAPPAPAPAPAPAAEQPPADQAEPAEEFNEIKSPMVGTFYAAPSPDSEPYVQVGDVVGEDTVVCIVEAMKVMNEIKAECAGTIVEVCVKNAQPVEFSQPIFRVKPS